MSTSGQMRERGARTPDACMYIFLNKGAGMSTGKSAAQAAHAGVEAYRLSERQAAQGNQTSAAALRAWRLGDHYKKIVLEASSAEQLRNIERYLNDRRFTTALIIDEGHTEIEPFTPTALGVEVVDKSLPHVAATFGEFGLYKDEGPVILECTGRMKRSDFLHLKSLIKERRVDEAREYMKQKYPRRRKWWKL